MRDIFFTDEGSGFPVIFIHGFCETSEMWEDYKKHFTKDYRVITVDLPGFGKSTLLPRAFSLRDVASRLIAFVEDLGRNKSILIAHSLGGYVTLEMINQRPELFAGFTLFHSTAQADNKEKQHSRNKTIDFVQKHGVEVFATSFVPSLFYQKNRSRLAIEIDAIVKLAAKTPLETLITYTRAMRDRQDRTDILKTFDGPIQFIAGDKDTSVPLDKIKEQAPLPQHSVMNVLKDTGHMGMFEQKEKTVQLITEFLKLCEG